MTALQLWQAGHRPQLTRFRWNSQNQLIGVQTPGGQQWEYRYDAFGRRTEKACERAGLRTTYLWDGDVPAEIREYQHNRLHCIRHLVFDGWQLLAQQVQFFSLNPENRHELLAGEVQMQYAVCAPTGEPLALFDAAGHRVWRQPPQSLYGLRLGVLGENAELNPGLQFAGQWLDEESGLVYNRFRYYSPVAGQYLTPDPIGLMGGENPYAYVHNPSTWVDPMGLAGCPWEQIDRFRSRTRLPVLGNRVPAPNDGLQTVAFVSIGNRKFFGMNRQAIPGLEYAAKRKEWFRKIYKSTGVEPSTISKAAADAEGLALVRAYERITKSGGKMPKEVTMFVDRPTCDFCKNYLPLLRESMGIEKLVVYNKGVSNPLIF